MRDETTYCNLKSECKYIYSREYTKLAQGATSGPAFPPKRGTLFRIGDLVTPFEVMQPRIVNLARCKMALLIISPRTLGSVAKAPPTASTGESLPRPFFRRGNWFRQATFAVSRREVGVHHVESTQQK